MTDNSNAEGPNDVLNQNVSIKADDLLHHGRTQEKAQGLQTQIDLIQEHQREREDLASRIAKLLQKNKGLQKEKEQLLENLGTSRRRFRKILWLHRALGLVSTILISIGASVVASDIVAGSGNYAGWMLVGAGVCVFSCMLIIDVD